MHPAPAIQPGIHPRTQQLFTLLTAAIAIVYLTNAFTPLHLHVDSVRYYNIKDCIELGCPPESFAATDYLPIGYTGLLLLLSKAGILTAPVIVIVNCLFLFGALYFLHRVLRKIVSPALLILFTVFNWTVIKFAAHPLSEMQYLFFSCASLYYFDRFLQRNSYLHLGLAFVFCFITILTRTVGIALLPALFAGIAWQHRARLRNVVVRNKFLVVAALALIALFLFFGKEELRIIDYITNLQQFFSGGILNFFTTNIGYHATELTEITINLPSNKVTGFLPGSMGNYLFIGGGIMLICWFLYLLLRKSSLPFFIRAYLGFYILIILNWPYYDPRFWVPVIPLLAALVMTFNFDSNKVLKFLSRAYLVFYIAVGFAAAAYSLYVGLDKKRFATNHAAGAYRNEYEIHFFGKPLSDTARHRDADVLDILEKHD